MNKTVEEIQRQISGFLESNSFSLKLPTALSNDHPYLVLIIIKYLLPQLKQFKISSRHKKVIAQILQIILTQPTKHINQILQLDNIEIQAAILADLSKMSKNQYITKLISIHSLFLNYFCEGELTNSELIRQKMKYKQNLYFSILTRLQELIQEQQLMIVNKFLLLGEEQLILRHYMAKRQSFLLQNFAKLSKQSNIIKYLYIATLTDGQQQKRYESLLIQISNKYDVLSSIVSLLSYNDTNIYSKSKYKHFYSIFSQTNKKLVIFEQLLRWWSFGKNYIITDNHAKIRCNILALFVQKMEKQMLLNQNTDYTLCISEGIKKRLTDGASKCYALLVWKIMAKKLDLPLTQDIENATFFQIQINKEQIKTMPVKENTLIQKQRPIKQIKMQISQKQQSEKEINLLEAENHNDDVVIIQPKNIYDCILGLRNPHRIHIVLKKLPQLIVRYKQDLVLMWNSLLRQLFSPLKEQYHSCLVLLFNLKPQEFIESTVLFFMSRDTNISEKIWLMVILKEGIIQITQNQQQIVNNESSQSDFYFKKVKSRYVKQSSKLQQAKDQIQKDKKQEETKTKRWGHTRIAYENKLKGTVNINILKDLAHANRLYGIVNQLYFQIIDIFSLDLIDSLRKHQIYVQHLLQLLSTLASNIRNHFDKYLILFDISVICSKIIKELRHSKQKSDNRYEENGGQTLMLCLQVLNKISLVVDRWIPEKVLAQLKESVQGAKKLPNYGMSVVLQMIEANIYRNVYAFLNQK